MATVCKRSSMAYYHLHKVPAPHIRGVDEMHGARRVVVFCLLTAVLPTILLIIPLYLRHHLFADVSYSVAESDILKIEDGISTVFCKEHTLKMNNSFNAYQLESEPEVGTKRKHIHLKKSMSLPDDTLEYWGFFLPKGSQMGLTVCSKSDGARILVVKGDKNLNTCGLLDHVNNKKAHSSVKLPKDQDKVWVIFETVAQEMQSNASDIFSLLNKQNKDNNFRNSRSINTDKKRDADFNDAREVENTDGMKAFIFMKTLAKNYFHHGASDNSEMRTPEEKLLGHKLRHAKQKSNRMKSIHVSNSNIEDRIKRDDENTRKRRNIFAGSLQNLDITKVAHGGNFNFTNDESSASSFETNLFNCYNDQILLHHVVPSSAQCLNTSFLFSRIMTTTHNVTADGYYYYIFYSDNDDVRNSIHATFDIFKPTYQYSNYSKQCTNKTECTFPLDFMSNQRVIVEVPTKNGIEHEGDDITLLLSVCQPRMSVYIIFPVLVLFLILGCAFL
ncbi:hypothetical protein RUM43_009029 [Polyplax serrata]|uniref:E3 ubiquitin-protein ligase APD1-4 middle domain-containing protein n=1 Tax=Polyplax serrata TaxID=468196 RepID=A0AAN8S8C1_POLSC